MMVNGHRDGASDARARVCVCVCVCVREREREREREILGWFTDKKNRARPLMLYKLASMA